jgi:hypothetical protein
VEKIKTTYMQEDFSIGNFEFELNTSVDIIKEGKYYPQTYEDEGEYPSYSLQVNIDEIDWNQDEYTDEENKMIADFINKNERLIIKSFEEKFERINTNWNTEEFYMNYMGRDDDYGEDLVERDYDYQYAKGGKVKKMYAVLVSPMGEMIADVEVDSSDERKAREKFREMGITQAGSIRFSNNQPHYYEKGGTTSSVSSFSYNGGEFEDILMDKIYDVEFGMYRIGDYFIIPQDSEAFPYHVVNREGHILYKAESLMDAADWADSRYYESGGLIKALGLANDNLNKNGIVLNDANNTITLIAYNSGNQDRDASIYNKALIYRAVQPIRQANEIIERFDNNQYENFDESKIESYKANHLIIVNQNEVIYDSEAVNNLQTQEIVVIAKDLDKDGGGRYKFRFLVYEDNVEEAKKIAATLWEKTFSDSDLSVVEILTDAEWRKKYFKEGGLISFDELSEATTDTLKDAINKYQQQIEILNKIASPTIRDFAEFSGLTNQIAQIKKILRSRGETFKKGGKVKRVRFIDKVESISERLEGTKVPSKLKKDYGGRYSREEAEEAARRIAGAQLRDRKMSDGGMFPLATGGFLSFPATGNFIKLSDYYKTLPDKELLVGLKVYDEVNEEYIYIKSMEGGIFAGKNKNDDYGFYYTMPYLLVDKKDLA